ncbi:glutathione S-transferase family protein [Sphingomonas sp. ID0503]|uniref:glutathione S-transferase family protein n=1 Tax=Sphingomonas sp. ID0503 TaxID=3399691 RepID=UPI003AFAB0B5
MGEITVSAMRWVPEFARGHVRDYRVRWMLEELGIPYESRLVSVEDRKSGAYRAEQPFGQVPVMSRDGVPVFETGAILLLLAEQAARLLPKKPTGRVRAISWLFASLNSIEPFVMNLAEVDYFETDEEVKKRRRPGVVEMIRTRLDQVETALGDDEYLAGEFSIADMMLAGVLRGLEGTDILDEFPKVAAFQQRCLGRPAFQRAIEAQLADFEETPG